jgi:tetratricopeptide (TPR) repeat protein
LPAYREAEARFEQLVRDQPNDLVSQVGLATTYHNLGYHYVRRKQPAEADAYYQRALPVRERLARDYPESLQYAVSLAQLYNDIGFLKQSSDPAAGLAANERALAIRTELARAHPHVLELELQRSKSHNHIGDVYREVKQWDKAVPCYEQAIAIQTKLVAENPAVLEYQRELENSYNNLATTHERARRFKEAVPVYEHAISLLEALVRTATADDDFDPKLKNLYEGRARVLAALNRTTDAARAEEKAIAFLEEQARRRPDYTPFQFALARAQVRLGIRQRSLRRQPEALNNITQAITTLHELAGPTPADSPYCPDLAGAYTWRAYTHADDKRFDQVVADCERALALRPKHLGAATLLAWALVLAPPPLRDPHKALPHALAAVQGDARVTAHHRNLGMVYFRLGRYREAIEALDRAGEIQSGGPSSFDRFFAAMCHHRLGDGQAARAAYDQAMAWWQSRPKLSPVLAGELQMIHAEADEVLAEPAPAR